MTAKSIPDWDVLRYKRGEVAETWMSGKICCAIIRGGASWCGYVGVEVRTVKAGFHYDDMGRFFNVHGGLTFDGKLPMLPGWYFYGWDYAHAGDEFAFCYEMPLLNMPTFPYELQDHRWMLEDVKPHVQAAAIDLAELPSRRLRGMRRHWIKSDPKGREMAELRAKMSNFLEEHK